MTELLLVILTAITVLNGCAIYAFYKYFVIVKKRFEGVSHVLDDKVKLVDGTEKRLKELEQQITVIKLAPKR